MWGIMATSPFSNGGSSSGIWSVIIIVTYIHGEFSTTDFLQEKAAVKDPAEILLYFSSAIQELKRELLYQEVYRSSRIWTEVLTVTSRAWKVKFPCKNSKNQPARSPLFPTIINLCFHCWNRQVLRHLRVLLLNHHPAWCHSSWNASPARLRRYTNFTQKPHFKAKHLYFLSRAL